MVPPSPVPPWPELARHDAEERPAAPRADAPWPEIPVREVDDAERSLDEVERRSRLDALAVKLGEEPWNASPS